MLKEILKDSSGVPTGEYKDIAGGTMYADSPIGSILPYGGTTAPSGWMICNGASLLRASYPELFAVIGTAFGSADATHFNIPDLRGEFLRGAGTNSHSGQGDGGSVGTHQNGTTVVTSIMGNGYGVIYNMTSGTVNSSTYDKWVGNSGNTYVHNTTQYETESYANSIGTGKTRPTNTSVNYIIKAKMVALPADLDAGVDNKLDARFAGMKIVHKTFSNKSFTANTDTNFDLSDILADVDDLIDFSVMVYQTNSSYYKLPYFSGGPQLYCNAIGSSRVASIHCGSIAWPSSYYVTFTLYIKA